MCRHRHYQCWHYLILTALKLSNHEMRTAKLLLGFHNWTILVLAVKMKKMPNSTNVKTKVAVMTNSRKEKGRAKVCDRREHRATPGR